MEKRGKGVWFITGASSGFGYALAAAVLERGGSVVATSRDPGPMEDLRRQAGDRLLTLPLDVTNQDHAGRAVAEAEARFGRIDVLVNNAGYGLVGSIEEASAAEIARIFDVNFLGQVRLLKAVLPDMRRRRQGFIVNISSIAGVRAIGGTGYYCASKFAVEGMSEALRLELEPLGIGVLVVEPGAFRTNYAEKYLGYAAHAIADYEATSGRLRTSIPAKHGTQPGDPARGAQVIIDAVESATPPVRLPLGRQAVEVLRESLRARLDELERWALPAIDADFPE